MSRENSLDVENKVTMAEYTLGVAKICSGNIKRVIFRYSNDGVVTQQQLDMIFRHLQLEKAEMLRKYIEVFYKKGWTDYDAVKLSVFGVMFGADSMRSKSKLMFNLFSLKSNASIEHDEVRLMINTIIEVAFSINLRFAIKYYEDIKKPITSELSNYKSSLESASSKVLNYFMDEIMGEKKTISLLEFMRGFNNIDSNSLLNGHILRVHSMMIDKMSKENKVRENQLGGKINRINSNSHFTLSFIVDEDESLLDSPQLTYRSGTHTNL